MVCTLTVRHAEEHMGRPTHVYKDEKILNSEKNSGSEIGSIVKIIGKGS